MKFKDLAIGDTFKFDHQGARFTPIARGPWVKISARKYVAHQDGGFHPVIRVGTISVPVVKTGIDPELGT